MLNISGEDILGITEGKTVSGKTSFIVRHISLDSRTINKGDFFIAIKGDNFDGHDFIPDAYRKGAAGALCNIDKAGKVKSAFKNKGFKEIPRDFSLIKVDDTLRSLGYIAAFFRRRFKVKTIAVTGSNGKTTTKELIYNLLLTKYNKNEILYTEKNYNNEIGVPQTVFQLNPKVKVLVVEMGINHIGEMQRLSFIVDPHIGLITNIGDTHLEFLKNNKIVAKAKSEMIPYIKDLLIINFDDTYYNYFMNLARTAVKAFTLSTQINLKNINHFDEYKNDQLEGFVVRYRNVEMKYRLVGEHNLYNLLAALTVVDQLGVSPKKAKKVVEKFKSMPDRGNCLKRKNYTLYFDAYNANPTSTKAMLYFINNLKVPHRVAILGDMMELGKKAMKYHTEVLQYIENLNLDRVITFGNIYKAVRRERYVNKQLISSYTSIEKVVADIKDLIKQYGPDLVILIKGSRKMEMEKFLKFI
ncbi:MAG: UDP-N-acetylmuramoyl-tripeptide--D-alanyl-D-alanine ligase [Spirochaetes bacterium]|nr:UDP-N-acetylmuramoyl-tripeptide--D-alanyl-D-alanine ligase [Spirochaetota bacterium]